MSNSKNNVFRCEPCRRDVEYPVTVHRACCSKCNRTMTLVRQGILNRIANAVGFRRNIRTKGGQT